MMFRRRTTDQVYATLQQVQRRITEQGGNAPAGPPLARAPVTVPLGGGRPTLANPLTLGQSPAPADRPTSFPGTAQDVAPEPPVGGYPKGTLHLPIPMAVTLFLLWLVSLVATALIAYRVADRQPTDSVASNEVRLPAKSADPESPPPGRRLGNSLFVLKQLTRFDAATRAAWQAEAENMNRSISTEANARRGWRPYFAVREPVNGGLQLVFGFANGQFGIERKEFEALLQREIPRPSFPTATWMSVD